MCTSADPTPGRSSARSTGRPTAASSNAASPAAVAAVILSVLTAAMMFLPGAGPARADTSATQLVWSTVSPPVSPPPLAYASAAYDNDNATLVLFGGVTPSGALSDNTWVWDGSTWRSYAGTKIVAPAARELAAMAFDPVLHQLILFGGRSAGGALLGDTWAWNGASWYQVGQRSPGPSPSPREGAAMAYDGHGNLVLFGGDGTASGASEGSSSTSVPSKSGTGSTGGGNTAGTTSTGAVSAAASTPSSASSGPSVTLADTWLWTSNGWTQSPATGPGARTAASMAFDSGSANAVMFGGSTSPIDSATPAYLSDTWVWTGSAWSAPQDAPPAGTSSGSPPAGPGPAPSARFAAAATDDPLAGGVVLFGGAGPAGLLSDTWLWNGQAWSAAPASGGPVPRAGAAGGFDGADRQFVLYGGAVNPGGHAGSGGAGFAGGNSGSTIGGASSVLGITSVLTAGTPVGLGTTPGTGLPTSSGPVPSTAPTPGTQASVLPGGPPLGAQQAGAPNHNRSTAMPLEVLHRGDQITLRGSGFSAGTKVTITFHSAPTFVGTTTSARDGSFEITVAVPRSAAPGTHHFVATGEGPKGPVDLLIATVEVVAAGGARGGTTATERAALVGLALAVPLATWMVMGGLGRWRRRQAGLRATTHSR